MQALSVALGCLDSMAEGVTQIQNSAQAALALVGSHDASLGRAATLNGLGKHLGVARAKVFSHLVKPAIERGIADQPVFNYLSQTRGILAIGQCSEHPGIDNHRAGLVERADHILAQGVVHRGLATDAGIDLGQKCSRYLQKAHTALIARRGKAGHIAHNPTTEGNHRRAAVVSVAEGGVEDSLQHAQGLVRLAVGQDDPGYLQIRAKRSAQTLQIQGGHRFIGHQ